MNQDLQLLKEQHLEFGNRIAELEERIKKEEKPERWIPEIHQVYYYIEFSGKITEAKYFNNPIDEGLMSIGGIYKTHEEAERIGLPKFRKAQFEHELHLKIKELNGDWEWKLWVKYYTPYIHTSNTGLLWNEYSYGSGTETIKVSSMEVGRKLESYFGERLIKYIKGEEL